MSRLTTGIFIGGLTAVAGVSYFMQDRKPYNTMIKKGKKMAIKAEDVMEDIMDEMTKN